MNQFDTSSGSESEEESDYEDNSFEVYSICCFALHTSLLVKSLPYCVQEDDDEEDVMCT